MDERTREFVGQTFGIYPRVSTLAQAEDDKASLDAQIESCQEYGEDLGMVVDEACIRKESHTATTSDRPELAALLRDMKARRVRNLVVDRVDRVTREGQLPAAILLERFTAASITLHIVSMDRCVKTSEDVNNFLAAAYAAEQANVARMRALRMARRAYARKGRYLKGNRAPYGFQFKTVERDSNGRPTKYHLIADRRETNGHRPWDVRRRICLDFIAGESYWGIAKKLTDEGVPTSLMLAGQRRASPHWSPSTVHDLLYEPLNEGIVTSFRQRMVPADPDAKHASRWKRVEAVSPDKQIPISGIVDDPLLSPSEVEALQARLALDEDVKKKRTPINATLSHWAMLREGMVVCGMPRLDDPTQICGGSLRVKTYKRTPVRRKMQYACQKHDSTPSRCSGLWLSVVDLDSQVWGEVIGHLLTPGKFEEVAQKQSRLDTDDSPASRLKHLQNVRADLARKATNLQATIADTDDPDLRADFLADLKRIRANLQQAEQDLDAYERLAADYERKRALLGDIEYQTKRHMKRILELTKRLPTPATPDLDVMTLDDIESMHRICQSLGVRPIVRRFPDGTYTVTVEFNIGSATGVSWFPDDAAEGEAGSVGVDGSY